MSRTTTERAPAVGALHPRGGIHPLGPAAPSGAPHTPGVATRPIQAFPLPYALALGLLIWALS